MSPSANGADDDGREAPFYHGTKADLKPGDLIEPGRPSNFFPGMRSPYVYLTRSLATWGAELAAGEGPGRIYLVEPTGPIMDDPDLTDKRFPGNLTQSYCSRYPLRVIGEVTDWQGHSAEEIQVMKDAMEQGARARAAVAAQIPSDAEVDRTYEAADETAREWAPDTEYLGSTLLMLIRGADVHISWALDYRSPSLEANHSVHLPAPEGPWPERPAGVELSGRLTDVTGWREAWGAVLESCATEIGLGLETRVLVAVDADPDTLTFHVDAQGPERSWHRAFRLAHGVLADLERGEIWSTDAAS